jgi:hypothetical protein
LDLSEIEQMFDTADENLQLFMAQELRKQPSDDVKGAYIHAMVQNRLPTRPPPPIVPIFEKADEFMVVGDEKFGAEVGYKLAVMNPIQTDAEKTFINTKAYANLYAFGRKIDTFDSMFRFQSVFKEPEAYVYFSLGGCVWNHCEDLIGNVCERRGNPLPPTDPPSSSVSAAPRCYQRSKELANFHAVLFKITTPVPLLYGIFLNVDVLFGSYVRLETAVSGCAQPPSATTGLIPTIGVDVVVGTRIDLYLIALGVDVNARLLYTDFPSSVTVDAHTLPIGVCAKIPAHINAVAARLDAYIQLRDQIKRCWGQPCGLKPGRELRRSKEWPGFARGRFDRLLLEYCFDMTLVKGKLRITPRPKHQLLIQQTQ